MTTVVNYGNDPIEKMYRVFRKAVEKSGLFGELRKKEFYEKPSIAKRKKHLSAIKRMEKDKREELEGMRFERGNTDHRGE